MRECALVFLKRTRVTFLKKIRDQRTEYGAKCRYVSERLVLALLKHTHIATRSEISSFLLNKYLQIYILSRIFICTYLDI